MSLGELIFYASMCAVGAFFAAHISMDGRRIGLAFLAGWIAYVSAWLPSINPAIQNPAELLGLESSRQIWATVDCLIGLYVIERATDKWWGISLFGTYSIQVAMHSLSFLHVIEDGLYFLILNWFFGAQVLIFILAGQHNVRDRLVGYFNHGRNAVGSR